MASDDSRIDGDDDADRETPVKTGESRNRHADARDEISKAREMAAEARDDRAEFRDDRAEARDEVDGRVDVGAAADREEARRDRRGAARVRAHCRSYDVIVRFGGDEFVCGLPELTMGEAAERFSRIKADLAEAHHISISVGLAELAARDSLDDLIMRADEAMYAERQERPSALC